MGAPAETHPEQQYMAVEQFLAMSRFERRNKLRYLILVLGVFITLKEAKHLIETWG